MAEPTNPDLLTVTLAQCPIGLFMSHSELCLKTEYGNNEGRIDAYIVSSGEFFWGGAPQTIASQRAQLVTPVDLDGVLSRLQHSSEPSGEPVAWMYHHPGDLEHGWQRYSFERRIQSYEGMSCNEEDAGVIETPLYALSTPRTEPSGDNRDLIHKLLNPSRKTLRIELETVMREAGLALLDIQNSSKRYIREDLAQVSGGDAVLERVTQAIADATHGGPFNGLEWPEAWDHFGMLARAAIAAISPSPDQPIEGCVSGRDQPEGGE